MRIVIMKIFNQITTVKCETPVHTAEKGRVVKSQVAAKNLETTLLPPKIASASNCKKMKAPANFSRRNGQVLFTEMCICNNLGLSGRYIIKNNIVYGDK